MNKIPSLKICVLGLLSSIVLSCGGDEAKKGSNEPTAYAGADLAVILPESTATLDGSMSTDPDGTLTYLWEKISGPSGGSITSSTNVTTNITDLEEGDYMFRLTVTDNDGLEAKDSVKVDVSSGAYYFEDNMDGVTITEDGDELVFNGWSGLQNHPYIDNLELNNIGGTDYAWQEIVDDPESAGTDVMKATILNDDPDVSGTTRAQMSLRFQEGVDLQVYHTSHRIYLNPDIAFFETYASSVVWFTIVEIWNQHVDGWSGDPSGSARWNLAILKQTGVGEVLYWRAESEYMQPEREQIWRENNYDVAVPVGEWFTLDIYMKRGEGDKGKMKFTITPDGGAPQVLFDISNSTIYPGHPEIPLYSWQPFKLYLDDTYLDWMNDQGKVVSAYYNDFKWHKN
jgi:hypothetical protein